MWNGRDPILKERLFGLTGNEGNHGEDVKECYYYLDSTPTHSYMKYLYKYPQAAFPYAQLVEENRRRDKHEPEFELIDTGVFAENRYFDVVVEYAKASPEDILIRITVTNRGPERPRSTCCPPSGSAIPGRGATTSAPQPVAAASPAAPSNSSIRSSDGRWLEYEGAPSCCSPKTRRTAASVRRRRTLRRT